MRESKKIYYRKHKEECYAKTKKWIEKNKDRRREWAKEYYWRNRARTRKRYNARSRERYKRKKMEFLDRMLGDYFEYLKNLKPGEVKVEFDEERHLRSMKSIRAQTKGMLKTNPELCRYSIKDNEGKLNCLFFDSSIGYCDVKKCPRFREVIV